MRTSTELVRHYFELAGHRNADPYLSQFSPDAVLEDEGVEYRGAAAIGAWHRKAPPVVYTVHDVTADGDGHAARVDIAGDFPGSPVPLTHHFTFTDDEHIATVTIRP